MIYGFDEQKLEARFILEDKDLQYAFEIKRMMQTPGWLALMEYMESEREEFIKMENRWVLDEKMHGMIQILAARRSGFEYCMAVAKLITERADKFIEREKEIENKKGGV